MLPVARLTKSLRRPTSSGETGCGVRTTTQATVAPWLVENVTVTRCAKGILATSWRLCDGSAEHHGEMNGEDYK